MGRVATNIAMELQAITATGTGSLFSSLRQQRPDTQAACPRVDAEIADAAEVAFKGELHNEMEGDEPHQLTIVPFRHQQTGISVIQLLL